MWERDKLAEPPMSLDPDSCRAILAQSDRRLVQSVLLILTIPLTRAMSVVGQSRKRIDS